MPETLEPVAIEVRSGYTLLGALPDAGPWRLKAFDASIFAVSQLSGRVFVIQNGEMHETHPAQRIPQTTP